MSYHITDKTWPRDDDGLFDFAPITLRAPQPGSLEKLTQWGIPFEPVLTEDEEVVAALVTEGDLDSLYAQLMLSFSEHGLWPIGAQGLYGDADVERPWQSGELFEPGAVEGSVEKLFERLNDARDSDRDEEFAQQEEIPKVTALADATTSGDVQQLLPLGFPDEIPGLVIVPVSRPADVPAALGWDGAVNHGLSGSDISLVLRSWEERFGAVPMLMGFDTLTLQVSQPPQDPKQIERVALEHYAFCPDNIDQGTFTLEKYLPQLESISWGFWWD